jgi:proline iminopeptidase
MKKTLHLCLALVGILLLQSCNQKATPAANDYFAQSNDTIQNGGIKMIPITTPKGTFNVWTKRVGNNPKIKVLLLNGGPGATHEYFECFENFLPAEGIEFIYYDQIGCGNSDNPNDESMWDLARYVEEVEQVRIALGLDETNFYLLGHSWGGILAMEYSLKYQKHMKGLIISNMMSSCPEYGKYADEVLAKQMNPAVLAEIEKIEAAKDFANPRYMELLLPNFYEKHILRFPAKNWPEPVNRSFAKMNQSLYVTMQGPSEFGVAGKLEQWDRKGQLKDIAIPTLVIGAQHDTMDPKHMEEMAKLTPKGTYLYCENGSHMCMYDDQKTYFSGLISFLKK